MLTLLLCSFLLVRDLGQIRSSLSAIICLYAIKYIREKRPIPFLIITLIAESIHKGAFIIIFAYLLANYFNKNITYFKTILYLIIAYGIGIFLKLNPALVSKLTNGSSYVTSTAYTTNSSASVITLIIQIIVILLYVMVHDRYATEKDNKFMDTIANVYLSGDIGCTNIYWIWNFRIPVRYIIKYYRNFNGAIYY